MAPRGSSVTLVMYVLEPPYVFFAPSNFLSCFLISHYILQLYKHREQEHAGDVRETDPTAHNSKKLVSAMGWGGTKNVKKPTLVEHMKTKAHADAVAWKGRQLGGLRAGGSDRAAASETMASRARRQLSEREEKKFREWDARVSVVIWIAVHAVRAHVLFCFRVVAFSCFGFILCHFSFNLRSTGCALKFRQSRRVVHGVDGISSREL
jgi:hypothetical protein